MKIFEVQYFEKWNWSKMDKRFHYSNFKFRI